MGPHSSRMRESEFQAIICLLQGPVEKLAPTYLDVFPLRQIHLSPETRFVVAGTWF